MKNIIYVHGASSTSVSFNYIKSQLPEHNAISFNYNSNVDVEQHVDSLAAINGVTKDLEEYAIISHSLGGIIATGSTYIHKNNNVRVVALSTPFAGSKAASYLKWLYPGYGLFDNVSISNPLILQIRHEGAIVPTLNIVTRGGNSPLIKEENDGVVSVRSQLSLKNATSKIFDLNHFQVLLSDDVVKEIKEFLW